MREVYEFLFEKGGYMMYPIVFCALLSFTILLERLWYLRRNNIAPPALIQLVHRLIIERKFPEAMGVCAARATPVSTVLGTALRMKGRHPEIVKQQLQTAGHQEAANLHQFLGGPSTIAGLATLLGLLGTVVGMIGVFQRVSQVTGLDADARTQLLSTGIWEILINTAGGLFIAVISIVAHGFLMGRVTRLLITLEAEAANMLELLDGAGYFGADVRAPGAWAAPTGTADPAPAVTT
ncbi:MAG: MotA/TolQ/ExbB proton channel family protein [Deltaproteobacteria bacterium]|nr:MotA/TolQ/ExbB proton channel family protein [Deltaproteobacteria bacterium]